MQLTKRFNKGIQYLCIASLLVLAACEKPKWDAFVFKDKDDLFNYTYIGEYKTFEACRLNAQKELKRIKAVGRGYYQCGTNCKFKTGVVSIAACEKIQKVTDRDGGAEQ